MKLRKDIDEKYKWDLSYLFKDDEAIEKTLSKIENLANIMPKYSNKLNDPNMLYEYLTKYEKDKIEISKLGFYLGNLYNVDSTDVRILKYIQKFDNLYSKYSQATAFFEPQMQNLPDKYLKNLLTDPRFKDYDNFILDIIKNKPHKISESDANLLSKMGAFLGDNGNIHSILVDSELEFEDAEDSNGKKYKVDNASSARLLRSSDRRLRETTFNSRMNTFKKFNKTFAELYLKDIELEKFTCKLEKHQSILSKNLFEDDIPMVVFENILKYTNKNIPLLQDFVRHNAKLSGLKDYSYYDLFEEKKGSKKYEIADAQDIILNALAPLGDEYISRVKKKLGEKSIDYLPNKHKNSGGYCSSMYDTKSVILMNFNFDYDSVSTLIHEMGHSMNAEYYNEFQPITKADIIIFSAEIASTVNEILLNQYMLKTCAEKDKKHHLFNFLEDVRNTIFRQTLFTEFELFAHDGIENEKPITYEDLNKCYYDLNKKYYGNSCRLPKNFCYEWERIPHFYNSYYVFTYATGMVTAITLASKILNEKDFYKKYIYFLKNGTNKKPIDILKEIGVDLTTAEPYEAAFKFISDQLKEYKSLTKLKKLKNMAK